MTVTDLAPVGVLDHRYSSADATPTPWPIAEGQLTEAKVYWLSTVRPDGRPHVTPIAGVWVDGAVHFATGEGERKALNLVSNQACIVTTGCNVLEGLDVVLEGTARRVTDEPTLRRIADAYRAKYDGLFDFTVSDGSLQGGSDDRALAFEVRASTAFAFGKGFLFSQTHYRF